MVFFITSGSARRPHLNPSRCTHCRRGGAVSSARESKNISINVQINKLGGEGGVSCRNEAVVFHPQLACLLCRACCLRWLSENAV